MTKKVKPAKKAKKQADKTPEITKTAKALKIIWILQRIGLRTKLMVRQYKNLRQNLTRKEIKLLPNILRKTLLIRRSW